MYSSHQLGALVLTGVLLVTSFAVVVATTTGTGGATELTTCTTIDEPGHYVLTANVTDSDAGVCLDIRSGDVAFDGNGHTVDGVETEQSINDSATAENPRSVGVGANVNGSKTLSNVTVENVTVTEWIYGVFYDTTDGTVGVTTASDNGAGMVFENASAGTVTGSVAENNSNGGVVFASLGGEVGSGNSVPSPNASSRGLLSLVTNRGVWRCSKHWSSSSSATSPGR